MSGTENILNFKWLFSKLAHSFVAIELLTFSKMQDSIFIAQESSQCFGEIDYIY